MLEQEQYPISRLARGIDFVFNVALQGALKILPAVDGEPEACGEGPRHIGNSLERAEELATKRDESQTILEDDLWKLAEYLEPDVSQACLDDRAMIGIV